MKIFILIAIILIPNMALAQKAKPPVLVELFSSQSCPACPPADEFIGTLAKKEDVIALACHVTYFGGPKSNPLGKPFCTGRQGDYIERIGRKSHYTPQVMVNGTRNVIGYETGNVLKNIDAARRDQTQSILIEKKAHGVYDYIIPPIFTKNRADIWMAIYDYPQEFKKRGKSVTYYNIVSQFTPMGQWSGSEVARAIYPLVKSNSAGFVIAVQDQATGQILAVGDYKL